VLCRIKTPPTSRRSICRSIAASAVLHRRVAPAAAAAAADTPILDADELYSGYLLLMLNSRAVCRRLLSNTSYNTIPDKS